jgi:hypothetical protein
VRGVRENSCARYVFTARGEWRSRRRVHQQFGERDLPLNRNQMPMKSTPRRRASWSTFFSLPHRDRDALRASSSALTTSHRRRASAEYSRRSSSGIASGSCQRRAVHSAMPVPGSPCSPSWSCERGSEGRRPRAESSFASGGGDWINERYVLQFAGSRLFIVL